MESAYEILGVSKTATQDEIRKAYRNLAKKYHPDLNPGNKEAERKFKDINHANDQVGSPEARAKYDREGEEARNAGPFGGAGAGPGGDAYTDGTRFYTYTQGGPRGARYRNPFGGVDEDVFESIFGSMGGSGRGGPENFEPRAEVYQMHVEFDDAIRGAEREITLPGGKRLRVKIPAGIESGKKLRFAGQGQQGADVLVEIQVKPSSVFKRTGNDLETEIPISIADAVLGGEVQAPAIDGRISLRVPPGVSSGQKLRAGGKGVPAHGSQPAGDLYVQLKIISPKEVDADLRDALRAWRDRQAQSAHPGGASP